MLCMKCGRELREDAVICSGCGAPQGRRKSIEREKLTAQLARPVNFGRKRISTWSVCWLTGIMICLSLALYIFYPKVSAFVDKKFGKPVSSGITEEDETAATEIERVTGEILVMTDPISDCSVISEAAYSDGSWEKSFRVGVSGSSESIIYKTLRHPSSEDWINTYVIQMYPEYGGISYVGNYVSGSDVSGSDVSGSDAAEGSTQRIRITGTEQAPGCIVDIVCIQRADFDHLFVVEMPENLFSDNQLWLEEWVHSLKIDGAEKVPQTQAA